MHNGTRTRLPGFSSMTPWRAPIAPGVVLCKDDHALLRAYEVYGLDLIGEDAEVIGARMLQANNALKQLHGPWTLHAEAQRGPLQSYPQRAGRFVVPQLIDEDRAALLLDPVAGAWVTQYYCALTWVPPKGQVRAVEQFVAAADAFMARLEPVLAIMKPLEEDDLMTYLHTTVSLNWHSVASPMPGQDLGRYLCDQAWQDGEWPDWDARLGPYHVRLLTLAGYPRRSYATMMQRLETLAVPFRWSTRWGGIQPQLQDPLLAGLQKDWIAQEKNVKDRVTEKASGRETRIINEDATRKTEDLGQVRQDIGADFYGLGNFTPTICTWGITAEQANAHVQSIKHVLETLGFVVRREGEYGSRTPVATWLLQWLAPPHHQAAFLSMQPGNRTDNARVALQSTLAGTHMFPGLRAVWPGPERDEHLNEGPWFLALTHQSSLVRIVHYVRDVGHAMFLGNTGSGKSTKLWFDMMQWLMYRTTRGAVLDVGRTGRLPTLLCRGEWIDLAGGNAPLQPLRDIDQPSEFRWALEWLIGIATRAEVTEANGVLQEYIKERMDELTQLPKNERTMTQLLHLCELHSARVEARVSSGIGTRDASGLSQPNPYRMERLQLHRAFQRALRPFTRGGEWANIVDGVHERVLDTHLLTCEQMGLTGTPRVLAPVVQAVFHLVERRLDTRFPTWIVLEEAALMSVMPQYTEKVDAWLMTIRKAGGSLALVINSLEQAARLGTGILTSENTPTRWYFPNVEALTPVVGKVYDLFGLGHEEKRLIATARQYSDIYYVARERGRRLIHMPFSRFILDCIARNSDDDHALMDDLLQKEGREGFAAAWFRQHGYHEAAARCAAQPLSVAAG